MPPLAVAMPCRMPSDLQKPPAVREKKRTYRLFPVGIRPRSDWEIRIVPQDRITACRTVVFPCGRSKGTATPSCPARPIKGTAARGIALQHFPYDKSKTTGNPLGFPGRFLHIDSDGHVLCVRCDRTCFVQARLSLLYAPGAMFSEITLRGDHCSVFR